MSTLDFYANQLDFLLFRNHISVRLEKDRPFLQPYKAPFLQQRILPLANIAAGWKADNSWQSNQNSSGKSSISHPNPMHNK